MIIMSLIKHPQSSDMSHRESHIKIAGLMIKPFGTLDYSLKQNLMQLCARLNTN